MGERVKVLPGTGRGTNRRLGEGAHDGALQRPWAPTTTELTLGGPPSRSGEEL